MPVFFRFLFTIALCLTSSSVWANIVVNGGFEDFDQDQRVGGRGPSTWTLYSDIPGWEASRNFELWRDGFLGVNAVEGDYLLELNAHGGSSAQAFGIAQTISTVAGGQYLLSFSARARRNTHEAFQIFAGDLELAIEDHVVGSWNDYSFSFTALADTTDLVFESLNGNSTLGNLIDDVSVQQMPTLISFEQEETPQVPAPGAALLALLLAAAPIVRRRA